MRRVRCDLKDLPPSVSSHTPCSNCKERGLNCIDEYADVKATKLLRRGRRLQQVEAIYGKVKNTDKRVLSSQVPNNIPTLKGDFFSSKFWAWFCIQRPVLDPNEFPQRYLAHIEGKSAIGPEGIILAMLLVLWAASFGLDESGAPMRIDVDNGDNIGLNSRDPEQASNDRGQQKVNMMLQQILEHIDSHGILRRPTLDGARILLLVLPLMEEYPYLERAAMYEAALSHTRTLCNPRGPLLWPSSPSPSSPEGSATLTRIFLYAQIQDGILTTLKDSNPVLQSDDVDTLQRMISLSTDHSSLTPVLSTSLPKIVANSRLVDNRSVSDTGKQLMQLTSMPMRLSSICRKSHEVMTGLKTARRIEEHYLVDANGMREVWRDLEQCWHAFVAMRSDPFADYKKASIEYFTDAWLICIFECHYAILESLKRLSLNTDPAGLAADISDCNAPSRSAFSSSPSSPYLPPHQLFLEARTRCVHLLPHVLRIVRYHLAKSGPNVDAPNFFAWDTGLIRDGCLFAGLLAADLYGATKCLDEHQVKPEETDDCITPEEGVNLILSALAEMHWAFAKHEERTETIRSALQRRKEKYDGRSYPRLLPNPVPANSYMEHSQSLPYTLHSYSNSHRSDVDVVAGLRERRIPPNLNMSLLSQRRVESAPNTACSTTSGWTHYTPPTTASTAPISSSRGSPDFDGPFNGQDEGIFSFMPVMSETLDDFDQSGSTTRTTTSVFPDRMYQHRDALYNAHDIQVAVDASVLGL